VMSSIRPERWRLFLAVELSDVVRDRLTGTLEEVRSLGAFVRASPIDGIHLTLHFLGDVEPAKFTDIALSLRAAVATCTRFRINVAGVGAFPSLDRPTTLWAGVGGDLRLVHAATGVALFAAGVPLESRPYAPHLTLGRLRRPASEADRVGVRAWGQRWASAGFGHLDVAALSLIRSELTVKPPRYTTLERFPLQ
jgi:2'-5' RNA ligase